MAQQSSRYRVCKLKTPMYRQAVHVLRIPLAADEGQEVGKAVVGHVVAALVDIFTGNAANCVCNTGDVRTVDVTIRRLREKIEDNPSLPSYIITKRGVGYYLK